MKVCEYCRYWSEMCARALEGGPIEALCLCEDSHKTGQIHSRDGDMQTLGE